MVTTSLWRCRMRPPAFTLTSVLVVLLLGIAPGLAAAAQSAKPLPFLDPRLQPEERAADLVSRMTLDEKVSEMLNSSAAIPRLGVPAYDWWNEGLHGVARAGYATMFPQAIGMAATWDAPRAPPGGHRIALRGPATAR